jgi:hypothetical protein
MKQRLAEILDALGVQQDRPNARDDVERWLKSNASSSETMTAATWTARRTPRGFIDRHGMGARFSAVPASVKTQALRDLGAWATATFGSCDAVASEPHAFELQIFRFRDGIAE